MDSVDARAPRDIAERAVRPGVAGHGVVVFPIAAFVALGVDSIATMVFRPDGIALHGGTALLTGSLLNLAVVTGGNVVGGGGLIAGASWLASLRPAASSTPAPAPTTPGVRP